MNDPASTIGLLGFAPVKSRTATSKSTGGQNGGRLGQTVVQARDGLGTPHKPVTNTTKL